MKDIWDKKIPAYFGWFLIIALLPQIIGINGSMIDSLYKVGAIGILFLLMIRSHNSQIVSRYYAIYMFVSIAAILGTLTVNNTNIQNEIMSLIISLLLLYILYECVIGATRIEKEDIVVFYKLIVYFMLVASIYNMTIHFNSVLHFTSLSVYSSEGICSFFDNKNTYGVFLIFGTLAATILKMLLKQKRWSFFSIVFAFNELLALCRTAIILSVFLIGISFLVEEGKRKKNIVLLLVIVGLASIFIQKSKTINSYVFGTILGSTKSIESRNNYINQMLFLITGWHSIVGYGSTNATQLAAQYTGNQYYHNTYLKIMISGGALKMFLQISVIALSLKYGIRCLRYNKMIGSLCIMSIVVYMIYASVESVILLDSPVVAIMATMFILSMPILFYNSMAYDDNGGGKVSDERV